MIRLSLTTALLSLSPLVAQADARTDVEAATAKWIDAFNRKSATEIVKLYAPEAVFLGTSSPVLRDSPALVAEYFRSLATLGDATNAVGDHRVQVYGDIAINSGYYTLTRRENGATAQSPARFSFVYQKRGDQWLIVSHHSSALPAAR
ncbi:MAG: nuclear transport factor 2 family protein [Steroidobacteraceae bacterium]